MAVSAYAPLFTGVPSQTPQTSQITSYRRKAPYRGPLIVIPGGRARTRRTGDNYPAGSASGQAYWSTRSAVPDDPAPVSSQSAQAVRAFEARLRALPLRSEIKLNPVAQSVRVDGKPRHLTPREFELLALLARHPGRTVSRQSLLAVAGLSGSGVEEGAGEASAGSEGATAGTKEAGGGAGEVTAVSQLPQVSRAVDVHIAHLRSKLALPGAITTVRGRGYALNPAYQVLVVE
ncbi:MAG: winged helix-turn-helix domain-containing protein [Bifidobacteriaceae bacterium]|jgi:DNA-binding winged helix-turn-helix (wHTH) protein|nr:winged helix-turn-helix domain-containing protein [Bifidobacteriaceae bacterium]